MTFGWSDIARVRVIDDEGDMGLESGASTARAVPSGCKPLVSTELGGNTDSNPVGSVDKSTAYDTLNLSESAPGKFRVQVVPRLAVRASSSALAVYVLPMSSANVPRAVGFIGLDDRRNHSR